MSEQHTRELMIKHFPKCPICQSEGNYNVSPSNTVIQCNYCKAKFFSDQKKDLTTLRLISPSTSWVEESLIPIFKKMMSKEYSVTFWQNMKDNLADIEKYASMCFLKYEVSYVSDYPDISQIKTVVLELEDATLKIPELGILIPYENIQDIAYDTREIENASERLALKLAFGRITGEMIPIVYTIMVLTVHNSMLNSSSKVAFYIKPLDQIKKNILIRVNYARKTKNQQFSLLSTSLEKTMYYDHVEKIDPLLILKTRFAKGEIAKEQYEEMKKTLESD